MLHLPGGPPGLGAIVIVHDQTYRVATGACRPEFLGLASGVLPDHGGSQVEDRLCGAVVLFQRPHVCGGKVLLKVEDVSDLGAPPAVDRLIVVAHHHYVLGIGGEQFEQPVLGVIGVLVLVHQQVFDTRTCGGSNVLVAPQDANRVEQEIVKVHSTAGAQTILVAVIDLRYLLAEVIRRLVFKLLG